MKITKKLLAFKFVFLMLHLLISFMAYQFMVVLGDAGPEHRGHAGRGNGGRPEEGQAKVAQLD